MSLQPRESSKSLVMEANLEKHASEIVQHLQKLKPKIPTEEHHHIESIELRIKTAVKFGFSQDYKDIPVNGVRSMFKCASLWTSFIANDQRSQKDIDNFIPILHLLSFWFELFDQLEKNPKPSDIRLFTQCFTGFNRLAFEKIHAEGYYDMIMPTLASILPIVHRQLLGGISNGFLEKLTNSLTFGKSKVVERLCDRIDRFDDLTKTVKLVRDFGSFANIMFTNMIYYWTSRGKPKVHVSEHRFTVDSKYDIILDAENTRLEVRKQVIKKDIRFMLLKDSSSNTHQDKIVIYIHGGGFSGPKYAVFNNMFLKDLCNEFPGLTIMHLSYSYAPEKPFPHGILDCLESYLWLTSGKDEVKETLGFQPKDVIISGDSSGGNYTAVLSVILNEIRLADPQSNVQFPKSLLLYYPKVSLDDTPYPCSFFTGIDLLLNVHSFYAFGRGYIPFRRRDPNGNWKLVKNTDIPKDWPTKKEFDFVRSPFLSPVYYDKLQDLSEINILVMGIEFDPLLDEAIHICKEWKGNVELFFVPEIIHGGYIFRHFSEQGRKVFTTFVDMMKKALQ